MRLVRFRATTPLVVLALAGCGHDAGTRATTDTRPPVAVHVLRLGAASDQALTLPGRIDALEEVTVTARIPARLTALPHREGDRFHAGDALARFDAPETRAALDGAEAGLAAATLQRDLARRQEQRIDSLYSIGVAALREQEGAHAERRAAEAGWAQARAQTDQLRAGTVIEAPFDGVVVRRHVDVGATVGPGQPLLDVRSSAAGEIVAAVPESELGRLAARRAGFQIGDGPWRPATLARVDGMTDPATRTRTARFHAADGQPVEAGAFARLRLPALPGAAPPAAPGAALTVPSGALVRRGELAGVFVAEDGVARLRWLRVGRETAAGVEVLAGLAPADRVIADPSGLDDGRAVTVNP